MVWLNKQRTFSNRWNAVCGESRTHGVGWGKSLRLYQGLTYHHMRLIKKKRLLLLIVVFTVSAVAACGQRNPGPSEAGASLPEGAAQTEEGQAGLADDSLSETNKCLTRR